MHLQFPVTPLAFLNMEPWMIAIVIPVVAMLFGGTMGIAAMYFSHRRRELWHQTTRLALEKGQPLPAMPDESERRPDPKEETSNDFRGGLVLIGVGFGLFLFLQQVAGRSVGYVGAIPGFIGVALLISGVVRASMARKNSSTSGRPPQS
jgi:hypothetical protein